MKHVIITSGGCEEYIDGVRSLTNFATGKTGATIAQYFLTQGYYVYYVHGKRAQCPLPHEQLECLPFTDFKELSTILHNLAQNIQAPHAVLSAAAVSDFGVSSVTIGDTVYAPEQLPKLSTDFVQGQPISIQLSPHPKLIDRLRTYFPPPVCLIGFKLTRNALLEERMTAVQQLFSHSHADYVVSNDLAEINAEHHPFVLYAHHNKALLPVSSGTNISELAQALFQAVSRNHQC